jgi:glycosyltransferase involved in cell wall biosynthesis
LENANSTVLLIDSGGISHYTTYLAVGLSKYRNVILYGYSEELYSLTGANKEDKIKFHNISKRIPMGSSLLSSAIRPYLLFFPLLKAIISNRYDIVHIQGHSYLFFLFVPFLKIKRKPIYWTMHDIDFRPTNSGLKGKLESLQVRLLCQNEWLSKRVNAIIVHGIKLKDKLVSRGLTESKIYVVPHFDYKYLLRIDPKSLIDNSKGEYTLLFGKIKPYKGVRLFIDASRVVRKKLGDKFMIMIAGRGNVSYLNTLLRNDDLEFIRVQNGYIPEIELPNLVSRAKFLVLPYTDASQSGVVSLAYTFSKPVIVSNVGSIAEYVEHGVTGLIFESGDTRQLAEYIADLVENNEKCVEMGKNAYQKVSNEMSLEKCSAIINQMYTKSDKANSS